MIKTKPLQVDSVAWYRHSQALHDKLILSSRFDDKVDVSVTKIGDDNQLLIGVPREWCEFPWKGTPLDQRVFPEDIDITLNSKYPPRNTEQVRVINESRLLLHHDVSHIVAASTGFGKTFCATNIIKAVGTKTLVIVTKEDLLEAWPKELMKFTNLTADDIGIIQQNKCQVEDRMVCIAMVHTLAQRTFPKSVTDAFGLIIFDEVHHMAADTFSKAASMFSARLRLGFSATPERIDGKDFVFHGHIGDTRVRSKLIAMPPKILVAYTGWKLPMVKWWIDGEQRVVKLPHEAGKLMHVITAMAKDVHRNQVIVSMAVKGYKKGRWTVVLSELAEDKHLGYLREQCRLAGVPDSDMAFYKGGMKKAEREAAKGKRLVFATYGMTSEATDVPWWDFLILATPRANIVQAAGRVVREYPGKPQPLIFDPVDTDSDILNGYFKSRLKQYTSSEMKGEVVYL